MSNRWVSGVLLNILGQLCINLGTNIMKAGHKIEDITTASVNLDVCTRSPHLVKRFGAVLFATGGILNFVSFGFAAQSLLASLGSVQFISNVFFGRLVLGEEVVIKTWIATGVICCGNIFIVCFANRSSKDYTANDLWEAYFVGGYKYYCLSMIVLLFFVNRFYKSLGEAIARMGAQANQRARVNRYITVQAICYALFSAILGTQQMLQAKCLSELLRLSAEGNSQFKNPFLYAVLFVYCVATVFWLYRMNIALKRYDGLFIIPVLQVFWLVFTILSGGIYFDEFSRFSGSQLTGFVFGVLIVFFGVYLLMPPSSADSPGADDTPMKMDQFNSMNSQGDSSFDIDNSFSEDFDRGDYSADDDREVRTVRRASSVSFGSLSDGGFKLPEGLPPLGDGIPAPRRPSMSMDGDGKDGGDVEAGNVSDSLSVGSGSERGSERGSGRPRKLTREASAFGFDSEEVRTRDTRLLSFGFMPVVTQDTKMVALADWTIDQRRHWLNVEDRTSKLAYGILNIGHGGSTSVAANSGDSVVVPVETGVGGRGLIEMEPAASRRRSMTADGAFVQGGDLSRNASAPAATQNVGYGLKVSSADFGRKPVNRRSFTQPSEDIKDLLATFEAEKLQKKMSLVVSDDNATAQL